ncbi:hypothetical protein EB810_13185 [Altererythrobacter sp. FM1]|uniref:hypothetical protein n=1 Tax=Tsuneonella flava TaxID=2055955 RepID=UPI000C7F96C3|nr:hypothetical protein [Tsuneonella flava]ROT94033.1 hypothetical protein EB810_13185 [Altererythrobacter sp. FM1]
MAANLFRRGTLLMPSGPANDPWRKHLHIICTDPDEEGRQLLVPICSIRNDFYDRTCELWAGAHSTVHHPSYVAYRHAALGRHDLLRIRVEERVLVPREDLNGQDFLRVTRGITISKHTPGKIKAHYTEVERRSREAA